MLEKRDTPRDLKFVIREQELSFHTLTTEEKRKGYKLRHDVFVAELGWAEAKENNLDIDSYDNEDMIPLGLMFNNDELIAYLRITLPGARFMMEGEFSQLLGGRVIAKNRGIVEISKVCVKKNFRRARILSEYGEMNVSLLLYKGLYQWSLINDVNKLYMVVDEKVNRLLRLCGFPTQLIDKPHIMPDGVCAVAVIVDWGEFALVNQKKKPILLE